VSHVDEAYTVASTTLIRDSAEIPFQSVFKEMLVDVVGPDA
jgi:hypothetical protein